ncbi:AAA family ATPase [Shewanella algae]|uniref:AAA family ATPase n=1 Tax=Shewanella algae TaxID=38313 RepID=UPI0031F54D8C
MFTLQSFFIKHKGEVIYDCKFTDIDFCNREELLSTLIIGENGAGKSYLLKMIADFLRHAFSKERAIGLKYDEIYVEYFVDGVIYKVVRKDGSYSYFLGSEICNPEDVIKPSKLIALSFMINDKFSFSGEQEFSDGYRYLGIRASSNSTYTSTIQNKMLSSFLKVVSNNSKSELLYAIFDFVNLSSKVDVVFYLKRKTLFKRPLWKTAIKSKISSLAQRKRYISNLNSSTIDSLVENTQEFVRYLKSSGKVNGEEIVYQFDGDGGDFEKDRDMIKFLETLEFISPPEVKFYNSDSFGFEYTSSGEKHFVFTMINLLSEIEENSLVLIDEPELSLHPRWQMQYIKLLKLITQKYKSCHCIMASHSHFMVSDLEPKSSSLVSLNKTSCTSKVRSCELIPYDTYAWSAESILYEVFNLRTTRNYYFETDLMELLKLISVRSQDKGRIERLHSKISRYSFGESDPINLIINQSKSYIESL